jgi:protease-4
VNDVIFDDLNRVRKIAAMAKNDAVKAVIVHMNSQGGSVVGSEMLYNALLKMSKEKPVVVVMESVAASGGYLASLGADYIIAHNGTITGSIGVIMQSAEITDFADKVGVTFNNFKSDVLKASPNLFEKLTPEAKQATMDSIYEVYDYFIELVATRRNLDLDYVKKLADGRIYSGRQALDLKLVDAIGNEDTAIEWLQTKKDISPDLEVLDVRLSSKDKLLDILMEDFKTSISSLFASSFKGLKSII